MLPLLILSLLDLLSGIIIITTPISLPSIIIKFFFLYSLLKGVWSIFSSLMNKYYFDFMGGIDLIAGICLYYIYMGNIYEIFSKIGIIILLKAIFSFVCSLK